MAKEAIAGDGQEARFAKTGIVDQTLRRGLHFFHIDTIDNRTIEAECMGTLIKCRIGRCLIDARSHAILIVDADKHHRQTPESRHIHALVKNTLLHCTVAEKCERDRVLLEIFAGKTRANDRRNAAADNRISAKVAKCHIGNMHGTALAVAITGFLTADFSHHLLGISAARQKDTMAAMVRGERILWLHCRTNAGSGCLFANREMEHRTCRLTAYEQFAHAFFKGADAPHRPVEFEKIRVTRILHVRLRQTCLLHLFHDV
ncbi:hypothetical protein D3C80_378890 [compost metagenome]